MRARPGHGHIDHVFVVADETLVCGVTTDVDDPQGQGDFVPACPFQDAPSVPALGEQREHPLDRFRNTKSFGDHPGDLAQRDEMRIAEPRCSGEPGNDLICPPRQGRLRRGHGPDYTGQALPLRTELPVLVVFGHTAPEYSGLVVTVDGASRIQQEAGVVGLRGDLGIDIEDVTQPHGVERGLEPMLEGESHAEVCCQTQGGDHLGGSDLIVSGLPHSL
jgi:hypothetical protein